MIMVTLFKLLLLACTILQLASAAFLNVALRKSASMSSMREGFSADTAVDGKIYAYGYCEHEIIDTGGGYTLAWWKVDLQSEVQNATVRIYFRTDYTWRRNGVKLYTSTSSFPDSNPTSQGQLCHTVTGHPNGSDIKSVYDVTCPGRWRYLLLYTDTDNDGDGPVLDFGEVEVLMPPCDNGNYTTNCDKVCSDRKCKAPSTSSCDRDGTCPDGCEAGWRQDDCTVECKSGSYGPDCSLFCTNRKCSNGSSDCNHVTGQCDGECTPGYKGVDCSQACSPGVSYGVNCFKPCSSRHCVTSPLVCDHQTGQCPDGCESGWTGMDCISRCPRGTFGTNCREKCGSCDGVCDRENGICYAGCLDGYSGGWCNVTRTPDSNNNTLGVGALVGTFLGTLLVVVLLVVGVHVFLIRQGRLHWERASEDKESVQVSRDNTQMSSIARTPANVSEHENSSSHVYSKDYAVLDPEQMPGNKDYDVVQHKEYGNI